MNLLLALFLLAAPTLVVVAIRRRIRTGWDGADLTGWHPAHRDPAGDVWAVTPPCGSGMWTLFAPGSPVDGPYPYDRVTPAGFHATDGPDDDRLSLADVEAWMRPWIEQVTGARVVQMAEGWSTPYGSDGDHQEYVIYARVEAS